MSTLRLGKVLLDDVTADLRRPHRHAAERVGFLVTRRVESEFGDVLLAFDWYSIPDDQYVDDPMVGARISRDSIRAMLRRSLEQQVGALHVHLHDHAGRPGPSSPDEKTFRELTPAFMGTAPRQRHGALILSADDANGRVLTPDLGVKRLRVLVVGQPYSILGT